MDPRSSARAVPGLGVIALLSLAAVRPGVPSRAALGESMSPSCAGGQASTGDSLLLFGGNSGIIQPLNPGTTVASCSLHASPLESNVAYLRIREWDPVALAPDPRTIALRTSFLTPTDMTYTEPHRPSLRRRTFEPPLVTRSVPRVAEPPRATVAMTFTGRFGGTGWAAWFEPDGDVALPAALAVGPGGSLLALRGPHPVLAHVVCGDGGFEDLRVVQSVMRSELMFWSSPAEFAQRFRVPEPVEPLWVELAAHRPVYESAQVAILDATGLSSPPGRMPAPMVEAALPPDQVADDAPRWMAHRPFAPGPVLWPARDYWLYVRSARAFVFHGRFRYAGDSPDFKASIGTLHTRASPAGAWVQMDAQTMLFRIIGRSHRVMDSPPAMSTGRFRLLVAPNPTDAGTVVSWSGAQGRVRIEVLDVQGRRVAAGEGASSGAWRWAPGSEAGSGALPGTYFVHARDDVAGHIVERVVVVR